MKTIKSQGGIYRYLLFFTNNYHEKVRVEFGTTSEIKEILKDTPILTPPVYLFKKSTSLDIHGKSGIAGTMKSMLELNKELTLVLKSDYQSVKTGFLIRCTRNSYYVNPNIIEWQSIAGRGFYINSIVAKFNKEYKEKRGF